MSRSHQTPEQKVKHSVSQYLDILRQKGHLDFWWNSSHGVWDPKKKIFRKKKGKYELNGVADIICVLNGGITLFIETKSKTGTLNPDQKAFMLRLAAINTVYIVARCVMDVSVVLEPILRFNYERGKKNGQEN